MSSTAANETQNNGSLAVDLSHFQKPTGLERARRVQVYVEIPVSKKRSLCVEEGKAITVPKKRRLRSSILLTTATQEQMKMEDAEDVKVTIKNEEYEIFKIEATTDMKSIKTEQKVSKVEETLILPPETISRYLHGLLDFTIDPAPLTTKVSRDMLNLHYGMSKWLFLTQIAAARNPSQSRHDRRVICATAEKNPAMPRGPGCPGLLFSCRRKMTVDESPWSLFLRLRAGEWEYEGEYKCFVVGALTRQEFNTQDDKVKQGWAKKVLTAEKWPEYTEMRARVYLRKQDKKITPTEVKKAVLVLRSHGSKKKKTHRNGWEGKLTEGDILNGFERGEEKIDIIAMECVNYDHYFAQDLAAKCCNEEQTPPPSIPGNKSSTSGWSNTRTTRARGKHTAVRWHDTASDDEDEEGIDDSGEDGEED